MKEPQQITVTDRYNVKYREGLSDKEKAVLEELEKSAFPLPPKEIATITGINRNSVRVYLMRLKRKGFVACPFPKHYQTVENFVTKDRVGGGAVVPRVHKLTLVVKGEPFGKLGSRVLADNSLFKVAVNGFSNSVVVYVDCKGSYSFDYGAFFALVELVKGSLGVSDRDIEVRSFELNTDLRGVQLDGVQCVTLKDFSGAFERIYNKNSRVLRKEANIQTPLPLESAFLLLNGGISAFQVFQACYQLVQEAKGLVEAVKFGNRTNSEILRYLREIVEKQQRDPGSRPGNCEAHSGDGEAH